MKNLIEYEGCISAEGWNPLELKGHYTENQIKLISKD